MNKTLYLNGFSHRLCGRRRRAESERVRQQARRLDGFAGLVAKFIPPELFNLTEDQRNRIYSPWVTFIAFLSQVLTRGSACREAVRRVQAWRLASKQTLPDKNTCGYCTARRRLGLPLLRAAHERIGQWIEAHRRGGDEWCGRKVGVLDGCGVSMPDTKANRKRWPYAGGQKPGCGFPTAQLVGLFCLATGRLIHFAFESWKAHEIPLARQLIGWIEAGSVILTDRGFCGWGFIALLHRKSVDVVMRLHQRRKVTGRTMNLAKPRCRPDTWEKSLWDELPDEIKVRIVSFRIEIRGFRTQHIVLLTTLLDEELYSDEQIASLYYRRWAVELFFRDIKTTLGLDILRCLSPELIEKEVLLEVIAYNLIRALMLEAAWTYDVPVERLSFKGTVDTLRQWAPLLLLRTQLARHARAELIRIIASDTVPFRPNRSEPRARKRRAKSYQLLTRPRHKMVVSPSRAKK
jgi:hypothetical protein